MPDKNQIIIDKWPSGHANMEHPSSVVNIFLRINRSILANFSEKNEFLKSKRFPSTILTNKSFDNRVSVLQIAECTYV